MTKRSVLLIGFLFVVIDVLILSAKTTVVYLDENGEDARMTVKSRAYPFSAVGILAADGVFCNATVIGTNHILTAAHCLFNPTTGAQYDLDIMQFSLNTVDGQPRSVHGIQKIESAGVDAEHRGEVDVRIRDWAVLELDAPVNLAVSGVFRVDQNLDLETWVGGLNNREDQRYIEAQRAPLHNGSLQHIGYTPLHENSRGQSPFLVANCRIRLWFGPGFFTTLSAVSRELGGSFAHDCSTQRGQSGGAIFFMDSTSGTAYILGVQVAGSLTDAGEEPLVAAWSLQNSNFAVPWIAFAAAVKAVAPPASVAPTVIDDATWGEVKMQHRKNDDSD